MYETLYRTLKGELYMTSQERIGRMIRHEEADRVPIVDFPWGSTIRRWRNKGIPDVDWRDYFDVDKIDWEILAEAFIIFRSSVQSVDRSMLLLRSTLMQRLNSPLFSF